MLAYSSDDNALYVRRSTAWEKVASQSNSNTWNASGGQQTFYTTQFNRAAIPNSVDAVGVNFSLADNTIAPLIRMNVGGGVRTVTLYAAAAPGDVGKQWVIHDSARDATANNVQIAVPGGVTINGGAGPFTAITVDGGAIVVRVAGANAWETIGQ